MKANFKITAPLLALALLVAMMPAALAGHYDSGVSAYKRKDYSLALKYFTAAAKENPQSAEGIFYLGLTQVKLNKLTDARKSFEMVTHMLPTNHELAAKARNNISFITQNQIANASSSSKALMIVNKSHAKTSKPNYLTHALTSTNGKVVHFDLAKMPLKVYVESGNGIPGWSAEHNNAVTQAMQSWQSASRGRIRFSRTSSPNTADIIVKWHKNLGEDKLGVSPLQMTGSGVITQSDVQIAVNYPGSETQMPMEKVRMTAIHEFGHALGIRGHSPYPDDVMYFSDRANAPTQLSARDINTIQMLYSIEADVQNSSSMSTAEASKYFELYRKGLQAQDAGQTAQAVQYLRAAINMNGRQYEAKYALGIILLNQGVGYAKGNNIAMARRNFQDAVTLLKDASALPGAPPEARVGLEAAEKNLAIANSQP